MFSIVKKSTSPKLPSTGSLNDIHSLALVAEGMIVVKFKQFYALNAVVCLLAAFYVIDAEYPKAGGLIFLDQYNQKSCDAKLFFWTSYCFQPAENTVCQLGYRTFYPSYEHLRAINGNTNRWSIDSLIIKLMGR